MKYDAAKNSRDGYNEAIDELRKRKELERFRCERIGDAVLYCGDCLEILPLLDKVDAVVTDPPYGLGDWNNRGSNKNRPFDSDYTQRWDKGIEQEHIDAIKKISRHQIIWGGNYFLDYLHRTKQMFVWNKTIRGMHFNDCEIAWCSQWREASRVFDLFPPADKPHPTAKPLALMRWCIEQLPANAETILDPFMGSGTTGVACAKLGRKFIGIEIDETYFEIACKRIRDAYAQPDLFIEPPKEPTQEKLFSEES